MSKSKKNKHSKKQGQQNIAEEKDDIDVFEQVKDEYFYELEKTNKIDNKVNIALSIYGIIIAYNGFAFNYSDLFKKGMSKSDMILSILILGLALFIVIASLWLIFSLIKAAKSTSYLRLNPQSYNISIANKNVKIYKKIIESIEHNQNLTSERLTRINNSFTWLPFILLITIILSVLFSNYIG